MDCLAAMDKGNGERLSNLMHGHDKEWEKLFNVLHITDKAWAKPKYDNVKRAIIIIQSEEKLTARQDVLKRQSKPVMLKQP